MDSIRNKFDLLAGTIKGNVGILIISESKLDDPFPDGLFLIEVFVTPFHLDQNKNSGGITLFTWSDIPAKVASEDGNPFKSFYVQLNFRKEKWLSSCSFNPKLSNIESHLNCLPRSIDLFFMKIRKCNFVWWFAYMHGGFSNDYFLGKLQIAWSYKTT